MNRSRLPLTALRCFEAAGRLESFTLAAAELFVSQAAVSRQIRELEAQLGQALFERHHRRVQLTLKGRLLLDVLTASFDRMDAALADVKHHKTVQTVSVSVEPSFASGWLVLHLGDFARLYPDIDIVVDSSPQLADFRAQNIDLAIRHSAAQSSWPRTQSRHLCQTVMVAALSPSMITENAALREPRDCLRYPLLHEENRDVWQRWLAMAGVDSLGMARGSIFADGALVLQAALRGQGIALVDLLLAREELDAGRLVMPFDTKLGYGAYWLVARDFARLSPAARVFAQWLEQRLSD